MNETRLCCLLTEYILFYLQGGYLIAKDTKMEPINFIRYNTGGSFHIHLPRKPDTGSITASLYLPSGAPNGTGSLSLNAASSSVNAAAQPGAITLNIGSTTAFKAGNRYIVGDTDLDEYTAEFVTVKSKSNNTITLLRPLMFAHAAGDPIVSSQITVEVSANQASEIGRGHRIEISYNVSGEAQPVVVAPFDISRYLPISHINIESLRDLDPTLSKKFSSGISFEDLKNQTWSMLLNRIAINYSPGSLVGTINLTVPHGYLIRMAIAETAGQDYVEYRNLMARRFDEELKYALGSAAFDENQTGSAQGKYLQKMRIRRV